MKPQAYIFEGLGRSADAQRAEGRGGLPATRAARALGLHSASFVRLMFPAMGTFAVGKYGMHVTYYDLSDNGYMHFLERSREPQDATRLDTVQRVLALVKPYFSRKGYARFAARLHSIATAVDRHAA